MINNQQVIRIIKKHALELRKTEKLIPSTDISYLSQHAYSKWAIKELIQYVREHDSTPGIMVVEMFAQKMDWYACESGNNYMFSIAKDIALDILDDLLTRYRIKETIPF